MTADLPGDTNAITVLTPDQAEQLAQVNQPLSLNGVIRLSDDAAEALSKHNGGWLELGALRVISDRAADALSLHAGDLYLPGLEVLSSPALAKKLALSGSDFDSISALSQGAAAALVEGSPGRDLDLPSLRKLPIDVARELTTFTNRLGLRGLEGLDTDTARLLTRKALSLDLSGITSLGDGTAAVLASFRGVLLLDGLHSLSEGVLKALSHHTDSLSLDGLRSLSASELSLLLRCRNADDFSGFLSLNGLATLSDGVAEILSDFAGTLFLDGLPSISDPDAVLFSAKPGALYLCGLTSLTDAAAEHLACVHQIEVRRKKWPDSAAAAFRKARKCLYGPRNKGKENTGAPRSYDLSSVDINDDSIRSTLVLRDLIAAAPSALRPIGTFRMPLCEGTPLSREDFLSNDDVPRRLRSDVQYAVGDYLASLQLPETPPFVSRAQGPRDPSANWIVFRMRDKREKFPLNGVPADFLRRLRDAADPASYGDMRDMTTRVDPFVRSGRELSRDTFEVPDELCRWVEQAWAKHFRQPAVRAEAYKVNLYGPGDRFAMHRDTPERNLVGTFLLALSGWGDALGGGGLVVHDEVGVFRWSGSFGWAAFVPHLPHEVEPVAHGARATLAFRVYATSDTRADRTSGYTRSQIAKVADRIALCRNSRGQVGVLLRYEYSINGTALCGVDRLIYQAMQTLGELDSIPVAVHLESEADDDETAYWQGRANVYALTERSLKRVARNGGRSPTASHGKRAGIPFVPVSKGHYISGGSTESIEHAGNYAEPANIDTLYVHRALVITHPLDRAHDHVRGAGADLAKTHLAKRDLQAADLQGANLSRTSLIRARLTRAQLASANLSHASLQGADLSQADLSYADLSSARLHGACLREANVTEMVLDDARWDDATVWPQGFDPIKRGARPKEGDSSANPNGP